MKSSIRRTPRAKRDLAEAATFIARDNLGAALRFLEAADEAMQKLAEMPGMGRARDFDNPSFGDVRSWPIKRFDNYLLFYRPIAHGIEVLRVIHGARDIDTIFEGD